MQVNLTYGNATFLFALANFQFLTLVWLDNTDRRYVLTPGPWSWQRAL